MKGLGDPGVTPGHVRTPGPARDVASPGCPSQGTRLSLDGDKWEALSAATAECAQDTWAFFSPETNAEESVSAQLGLDGGQSSIEHLGSACWGPWTDRLTAPEAGFSLRSISPAAEMPEIHLWHLIMLLEMGAPSCPALRNGPPPCPQAKFSRRAGLGSPRGISSRSPLCWEPDFPAAWVCLLEAQALGLTGPDVGSSQGWTPCSSPGLLLVCLCLLPVYLSLLSGPLDRIPPRLHDPPLMEEVIFPTAVRVCACVCVCVCVLVAQSCPTFFDTMDHSPPGSSLSMGFSRPEYCSRWPFPPPGDLPHPGIELGSSTLQADSLPSEPSGKPQRNERAVP